MPYRVAVTRAFAEPDGTTIFGDIGLDRLTEAGIEWQTLAAPSSRIDAHELDGFDAVLVLGGERFDAESIPAGGRLRHVARFGVGYDAVDIDACAAAGITVTNTPEAVRRPMADTALTLLFALAHNLLIKDELVRTGRWNERSDWRGQGLQGRTVGIVGLGSIGLETARLLRALGITVAAYNRSPKTAEAGDLGITMLPLDELLAVSDYVVVTVAAAPGTHGLIGERELGLMKPSAFLINIARGSVVDEAALIDALRTHRIAGAGLDVFEQEPLPQDSPLTGLPNVVLAPHSLCWTDDFTASVSASLREAVVNISQGRQPRHAVRPRAVSA
ncbi:2-hydroxyacid dehydrogenase [Leifsonia shinshuensis]|uniref:Dehydrogenase n=1 Tax=Leifsonia shinshuensis TaxID=150026 RepID=A0A7G6YE39_9MICO|nr:NAD(P)-dependent oxidoreductase [Leifsonia shinshuensis]QNE36754.1 dehydrogenase [Leifsonia shinshuensis]